MSLYLSQNRIEEPIWLEPIDISFLRKQISETETQVESLQSQMIEVKRVYGAQISELMRQKDAKLVEIASFQNMLSPVRRIPVEILSEIFELACTPDNRYRHANRVLYMHNLSSVCAAWRKVAHATPRLWSKLCIDDRKAKGKWVEKWINRSRGLPLDVYLFLCRKASARFLEQILEFRHRFRTLFMEGHARSYTPLFNLPRSSFSQLEQVTLSIKPRKLKRHPFPNKIQAFLDAPKLHHIEIIEQTFSTPFVRLLMLPVEQLTTLIIASDIAISDAATSVYMDILPAFKGLVNLEISLQVHCQLTTSITSVARLLPALKSLKIDYRSPIHCYDFLRCLTSPLLERLSICGYLHHRDDMASTFTSIADFQRRSATSLSSLTLEYFDWDNVELFTKHLTETIGIFLDLQSLQLHIVQVDVDLLFRALTCSEGSQILLPKLTHLELQPYDRDTTRLSDGLTSMVLSRWWPDDERTTSAGLVRLQKVILRDFLYDEQITRISDLSGLKLSLDLCSLE